LLFYTRRQVFPTTGAFFRHDAKWQAIIPVFRMSEGRKVIPRIVGRFKTIAFDKIPKTSRITRRVGIFDFSQL